MRSGVDFFLEKASSFGDKKFVLLANQASLTSKLVPSEIALSERVKLEAILSPQHGFFQEKQANMLEADFYPHPLLKLPIYPVYNRQMNFPPVLEDVDGVIFDLQDVGVRVYTYIWTLYLLMKHLSGRNKLLLILDRPNPLGGTEVEGALLEEDYRSFVGLHPLPMRHGMTVGELALMFREEAGFDVEIEVFRAEWRRELLWPQLGFAWINPSPNLPSFHSALVYAGTVIFEGTSVSEGRGTTRPFEYIGAPSLNPYRLAEDMNREGLEGVIFRPVGFTPTFDKHRDKLCTGVHIIVTSFRKFKPYKTALILAKKIWQLWEGAEFLPPPYEYCYDRLPIDIITGSNKARLWIEGEGGLEEVMDCQGFRERREKFLLYN